MEEKYAPIVVSVYDRFEHLQRCISSLQANPEAIYSELYIVSDAAYKKEHEEEINKVRTYASSIDGFKKINLIFRTTNMGPGTSLGNALEEILKIRDRYIVLEDDIVTSKNFLSYMNAGLEFYKEDKNVFAICGFKIPFDLPKDYNKDIYFYPCNSPWGYATWRDREENADYSYFDRYTQLKKNRKEYKRFLSIGFYIKGILQADSRKEIIAGDVRVYYHMFKHNMYSVFPTVSKTQNHGFDGTGEHCGSKKAWWSTPELDNRNIPTNFIPFNGYNKEILENSRKFQDKINGGIIAKYLKYTWLHRLWKKIKLKCVILT